MFASLVAALGTPRAVALVEMGDERPHVREWVDYHLAVGFSHLYVTLSKQATEQVRATLLSYRHVAHRDRLWKTPKLEKLRDHKKTQARGYRPAVEPSDKAASDKAAAKAAAKAAVKAAAKAATKQNGDRSREAKAAAKARIRSQARREARRAHK